jgi:hypothetical protein
VPSRITGSVFQFSYLPKFIAQYSSEPFCNCVLADLQIRLRADGINFAEVYAYN